MRGLSLVVASGGHSSSRCAGLSLSRPLLLRSTGSRRASSVVVAHGPSCSAACGIFPDQGSNPCPLYWQADSQPLRHQGSPRASVFLSVKCWTELGVLALGSLQSWPSLSIIIYSFRLLSPRQSQEELVQALASYWMLYPSVSFPGSLPFFTPTSST